MAKRIPPQIPTQPILSSIATFFAEIGHLKRLPKNGMRLAGIVGEGEGTVGQHVVRTAQIGYVLAHLEQVDAEKTACILLFHDNGEIRIGDQHKLAARYFDIKEAELQSLKEQMDRLPPEIAERILNYFTSFEERTTPEGIVAKDADYLETAITALELYQQSGNRGLLDWVANVKKALTTSSAQKLLTIIENTNDYSSSWWRGLKKL